MSDIPKSIKEEVVEFVGYTLHFHVLDNGKKVIDQDDAEKFFQDLMDGKVKLTDEDVATLNQYIEEGL